MTLIDQRTVDIRVTRAIKQTPNDILNYIYDVENLTIREAVRKSLAHRGYFVEWE